MAKDFTKGGRYCIAKVTLSRGTSLLPLFFLFLDFALAKYSCTRCPSFPPSLVQVGSEACPAGINDPPLTSDPLPPFLVQVGSEACPAGIMDPDSGHMWRGITSMLVCQYTVAGNIGGPGGYSANVLPPLVPPAFCSNTG